MTVVEAAVNRPASVRGSILAVGLAALASIGFVLLTGILSIQIRGSASGAVYNLNNEVVGVREPQVPYLQYAALASLAALAIIGLSRWLRSHKSREAALACGAFAIGVAAMTTWGLLMTSGTLDVSNRGGPFLQGIEGWAASGATSSVTHALCLTSVYLAGAYAFSARTRRQLQLQTSKTA